MRSHWIRVGAKFNSCSYKKRRGHTGMDRRRPCEDRAENWNYGATGRAMPGASRSWTEQRRVLSQSIQRERGPDNTLISDFQPPEV